MSGVKTAILRSTCDLYKALENTSVYGPHKTNTASKQNTLFNYCCSALQITYNHGCLTKRHEHDYFTKLLFLTEPNTYASQRQTPMSHIHKHLCLTDTNIDVSQTQTPTSLTHKNRCLTERTALLLLCRQHVNRLCRDPRVETTAR